MRRVWPHVPEAVEQEVLTVLLHPDRISPDRYEQTVRMLCELEIRLTVEDAIKLRAIPLPPDAEGGYSPGLAVVPVPMIPMAILVILDRLRAIEWSATHSRP